MLDNYANAKLMLIISGVCTHCFASNGLSSFPMPKCGSYPNKVWSLWEYEHSIFLCLGTSHTLMPRRSLLHGRKHMVIPSGYSRKSEVRELYISFGPHNRWLSVPEHFLRMKFEMWECQLSITGGTGTAFPFFHWHFSHRSSCITWMRTVPDKFKSYKLTVTESFNKAQNWPTVGCWQRVVPAVIPHKAEPLNDELAVWNCIDLSS